MLLLNRRTFITAAAVAVLPRWTSGQGAGEFTLNWSTPFSAGGPMALAAAATSPGTVEVSVTGARGVPLFPPTKFEFLERQRSSVVPFDVVDGKTTRIDVTLRVSHPGARPFVCVAIGPAADRDLLRGAAENAFFVRNPASVPGEFRIVLTADSDVATTIKRVAVPGDVVRNLTDKNLSVGPRAIPWDLKDNGGRPVAPGDYTGTLLATPKMANRSDTVFFSTMRVIS